MQTYFPYSHIIRNIRESIMRHPFFGEWSVGADNLQVQAQPIRVPSSEIFY